MNNRPVKLMNSAMMPIAGTYKCKQVSEREFAFLLHVAHRDRGVKSYVGYKMNLDHLWKLAGVDVEFCRDITVLEDGDDILAMRRKYDDSESRAKYERSGKMTWEYFVVEYSAPSQSDEFFAAQFDAGYLVA